MDLSIIIVTYNSQNDIKKCLKSIIDKTNEINFEVCVVDNSSIDNTANIVSEFASKYKNIKLIKSENRGFNAGNNVGINNTTGEFIALLNPDTILLNNAFKIIIDNMKQIKNVGACGGCLYHEDLTLNMTHGSFPTVYETIVRALKIRKDNTYYLPNLSKSKMEVEFPSGADFVFKREIINKVGMLDEDYFLYFDETDYAFKLKKLGLKNYIFTEAKIIHAQGKSTESASDFAKKMFEESFAKYLIKNASTFEGRAIILIRIIEYRFKTLIFSTLKRKETTKYYVLEEELRKYENILRILRENS